MRSILNYLMVIVLSFMTASVPALAASSQQSSMESIEDLYRAHQVVAHIDVTDVRSLDGKLFCYRVRAIRPFKSGGADIRCIELA